MIWIEVIIIIIIIIIIIMSLCVFILFHCGSFFRLQNVCDIHEEYEPTMLRFEYYSSYFCQVFISISKYVIFHLWRRHSTCLKLERKRYDARLHEKMIYIDIGYKSVLHQTDKWRKETKDKEATLIYILPLWIKSWALA